METRNWLYYLCMIFFILLTFNQAALINAEALKPKRSEFGEQCNSTIKCSKSSWLTCQNDKICGCTLPDEMIFESNKNKCVSKASERCKFEIGSDSAFQLIEKAECVENSICSDKDGICNCNSGYFETVNGTCLPKGNFNDPCLSNEECKIDKFFVCLSNSTCGCNNTSEFSIEYKQCVGLAGQACLSQKCTSNAFCNNGICNCNPSDKYYTNIFGLCQLKKDFGDVCSNTSQCKSESLSLSCLNGICGCDTLTQQIQPSSYYANEPNPDYNFEICGGQDRGYYPCRKYEQKRIETFQCVGLANKPCSKNRGCVKNAQCHYSYGYGSDTCKCDSYYSANSTGMCARKHGTSCSKSEVCNDMFFFCTDGKCNCKHPEHQEYFPNKDKCLSIISGPCSSDEDCINDAFCNRSINDKNGLCQCKSGFIENKNGKCGLAHGAPCEYQNSNGPSCDTLAELQCRNGICSCQDESLKYDEELSRCVGLAGSRCSILNVTLEKAFCVKNSSCVGVRKGLETGRCKCDEGFIVTGERECAPAGKILRNSKISMHIKRDRTNQFDEAGLLEDAMENNEDISV